MLGCRSKEAFNYSQVPNRTPVNKSKELTISKHPNTYSKSQLKENKNLGIKDMKSLLTNNCKGNTDRQNNFTPTFEGNSDFLSG